MSTTALLLNQVRALLLTLALPAPQAQVEQRRDVVDLTTLTQLTW